MRQEIIVRENGTIDVRHYCEGESEVKESFKDQCDINKIMKRYERTGEITHLARTQPIFADVLNAVSDYKTAHDLILEAQSAFLELPSEVREAYGHDPGTFLESLRKAYEAEAASNATPTLKTQPEASKEATKPDSN